MRYVLSCLAVAVVALMIPAFAGPTLAQAAPTAAFPADRCAAAASILARLCLRLPQPRRQLLEALSPAILLVDATATPGT